MGLQEIDERFDREAVEPVINYVNTVTGIEWLSVGQDLGDGPRYISNIKMRHWKGKLAGVYALAYIAEIARVRGLDGHRELATAHLARNTVGTWLYQEGDLDIRIKVRDMIDHVSELGASDGHPREKR